MTSQCLQAFASSRAPDPANQTVQAEVRILGTFHNFLFEIFKRYLLEALSFVNAQKAPVAKHFSQTISSPRSAIVGGRSYEHTWVPSRETKHSQLVRSHGLPLWSFQTQFGQSYASLFTFCDSRFYVFSLVFHHSPWTQTAPWKTCSSLFGVRTMQLSNLACQSVSEAEVDQKSFKKSFKKPWKNRSPCHLCPNPEKKKTTRRPPLELYWASYHRGKRWPCGPNLHARPEL